ncbi:MAG: FIST N-terminal domain-containing protein [Pseudomonadota bacterium]
MDIVVTAAAGADTAAVLDELLEPVAARAVAPDFLVLHPSGHHNVAKVQAAANRLSARSIHGATSSRGVMTGRGVRIGEGGIGLFALWDAEGDYGTGRASLTGEARAAARLATERALKAAGRQGEAPDLVWLTAVPGCEEEIVAGIEAVVGPNTPILGGSAADDTVSGAWAVFDATGVDGDAVVVSVLFPSSPIATAYQSGYTPTETAGTVTRAEGRVVYEIDGVPAGEVYSRWTGGVVAAPGSEPISILAESTFFPLGRAVGTVSDVPLHLLAHPAEMRPDGGIGLFAEVAEGEVLQLMSGSVDGLTGRAGRVAAQAVHRGNLEPSDVAGALVIYCGGCMMAVQDHLDRVADDVDAALGGAPWLGIFTFGEQGTVIDGQNRHGNLMISCAAFAR